jgi:hypothetical protein
MTTLSILVTLLSRVNPEINRASEAKVKEGSRDPLKIDLLY